MARTCLPWQTRDKEEGCVVAIKFVVDGV